MLGLMNTATAPIESATNRCEARLFRRLMRKLFELGEPSVQLMGRAGEVRIVAAFGPHKVALGSFVDDGLDEALTVVMGAVAGKAKVALDVQQAVRSGVAE